jgi:hypothetical protein
VVLVLMDRAERLSCSCGRESLRGLEGGKMERDVSRSKQEDAK